MAGLKNKEKDILMFLMRGGVSFPINYIAKKTGMSWATAQSYLEKLEDDGYVFQEERLGKQMWKFNFDKLRELRRN
jgi:DNA-binding IclR family transcriptional regulator